jgi:hypothetical protein
MKCMVCGEIGWLPWADQVFKNRSNLLKTLFTQDEKISSIHLKFDEKIRIGRIQNFSIFQIFKHWGRRARVQRRRRRLASRHDRRISSVRLNAQFYFGRVALQVLWCSIGTLIR